MHGITRKLTVAFAAIAMSAGLASQASAATTTVRLHTQADTSKYLTDGAGGLAQMLKSNSSDPAQRFRKTDTNSGYATYTSVKSLSGVTPRCLTGRGLQGFPVVTVERCVSGALNQQWRLGVSGELQLRLNGLVASHNTAGNGSGVVMAFLQPGAANMKWHTHPA